jgi:predicted dithiol-disulfide oxidoreductase (DUF899 family)
VNARDTTFALVSPADQDRIAALKQRMDWDVPWYTLVGQDFGQDFGVSEYFGLNVFLRSDAGEPFRTYFVNARGVEPFTPTWSILDITPFWSQEEWEDTPAGRPQTPPSGPARSWSWPPSCAAHHWGSPGRPGAWPRWRRTPRWP